MELRRAELQGTWMCDVKIISQHRARTCDPGVYSNGGVPLSRWGWPAAQSISTMLYQLS